MPETEKVSGDNAFDQLTEIFIIFFIIAGVLTFITGALEGLISKVSPSLPIEANRLYQLPPQNVEEERRLLGSILSGVTLFPDIKDIVKIEDFTDLRNRAIFSTMLTVDRDEGSVNYFTVYDNLKSESLLNAIGGIPYIDLLLRSSAKDISNIRIPPRTNTDERRLLGALLIGQIEIDDNKNSVSLDSFRDPKHKLIYAAMLDLNSEGRDINLISARDILNENKLLEQAGGEEYLLELVRVHQRPVEPSVQGVFSWLKRGFIKVLQWVSFLAILGIIYNLFRLARIRRKKIASVLRIVSSDEGIDSKRWEKLVDMSKSENASDRKISIIEADSILHDLVAQMGYSGDTLGEKMKNIERSDFETLDYAWEAHKMRNRIAHQNEDISLVEAERIMKCYERVFREFEYI